MASHSPDALETLHTTIVSLCSLIIHLQAFPATPVAPVNPPNALALLSTSASLLRAQITKLSLLLLNKPFTPTAITHILRVLTTSILPALATGAQLASTDKYPALVATETRREVEGLLKEVKSVLAEIPTDERGIDKVAGQGRDALTSTGVIWDACDRLVEMGKTGVGELLRRKVEEWKDLLGDAVDELEGWTHDAVEVDNEELEADDFDRDHSTEDAASEACDDLFGLTAGPSLEMLSLSTSVVATLRLVQKLYPPLLRRRIRRLPTLDAKTKQKDFPSTELVQKVNALAEACHFFSSEADEIAAALYEADATSVQQRLEELKTRARKCMETMSLSWDGTADEVTDWAATWITKLDEIPASR